MACSAPPVRITWESAVANRSPHSSWPSSAEDQILADFDQRMREPAQRAVLVERVALELAAIGHVVADGDVGKRRRAS